MATSGSFDFVLTRDNLIDLAYQHLGLVGEGATSTAAQVTEASKLLNMIVKLRAADGMPLWALKRGTILPFSGAASIQTNSHVVTFYDSTTLAANATTSATALTIASAGTIANSDQIGIELDSGDMHWTTVSAGGGTTSLTIASGLVSAATSGNRVYAYTASADRIQRPLRIIEANMLNVGSSGSWGIDIVARGDYFNLGSRTAEGTPNQLYYEPSLGSSTADPSSATNWYGIIYIYPRFANGDYVIEMTYHRPFQDFDASGDNIDFPQEFYLPLMLELAAMLGPKAQVPLEERRMLFSEARMYREEALATVAPEGSFKMQPDKQRMY